MTFDYIDSGERLKFQILHTGTDEEIHVEYKIKGGKPKRDCVELRKESGIKKAIKAIVYEIIPMIIWLLIFLMAALFSNAIGITGNGLLITAIVLSIPLTLIMILIFIKLKNVVKQVFHRAIPSTLKNEN